MLSVIFCPVWELSPHSSINTDVLIYGTEAEVSCDDGFMFASGNGVEMIKCVMLSDESSEAAWNVAGLDCQRKLTAIGRKLFTQYS